MRWIVVCREKRDVMPSLLQRQCRVDDEALGAANAQIGVQECNPQWAIVSRN